MTFSEFPIGPGGVPLNSQPRIAPVCILLKVRLDPPKTYRNAYGFNTLAEVVPKGENELFIVKSQHS